ncbi:hypothetical protein Ancab_008117, partial [Ancistrocladus abbreviatus]
MDDGGKPIFVSIGQHFWDSSIQQKLVILEGCFGVAAAFLWGSVPVVVGAGSSFPLSWWLPL